MLSKKNDKLEDTNVKKDTGSRKIKTKKSLKSQIRSFMSTQDNTNMDSLYNSLHFKL